MFKRPPETTDEIRKEMNVDMDIPSINLPIQAPTTPSNQPYKITQEFANLVKETFDGTVEFSLSQTDFSNFDVKVDGANVIFKSRKVSHINSRCPGKNHHWVWDFVEMNQQRMVSIMVMKGHIKERLIANHKVCLLNSPNTNKFLIASRLKMENLKFQTVVLKGKK